MFVVNVVGISLLALFTLVIINKARKTTADYVLLVTIGLFMALLGSQVWINSGLTPFRFAAQNILQKFIFPSYVCYALVMTDEEHRIRKAWWWIWSGAVVFAMFSVLDMAINSYDEAALRTLYEDANLIYHVFYKGAFLFDIVLLSWLMRRLHRYRRRIEDYYSTIESIRLNWLYTLTWIFIASNVAVLSIFLLYNVGYLTTDIDTTFSIVFGVVTLALFYFSYNGMRQYNLAEFRDLLPEAVSTEDAPQVDTSTTDSPKPEPPPEEETRYKTSSLRDDQMEIIFQKLNACLVEEKVYRDPDLKVYDLAERLHVTTHNVSQTINTKALKSFYDFINEYRVNHFKQLLVDPQMQQYTILGLGLESGFNSKTSLNRIFKKHTGMSPSAFRRMQMVSVERV